MHTYSLGDHIVCLDPRSDQVQVLNPVAAHMWNLANSGHTAEEIATATVAQYDVSYEKACLDAQNFLTRMNSDVHDPIEEVESYTPITDYRPDRGCQPDTVLHYHLPGVNIQISSELTELAELLNPFFQLSELDHNASWSLQLSVFDDEGRYPIVSDGVTLDTGLTPADTAIKCLREINGLVARHYPWSIIFHASSVANGKRGILFPAIGGSGKTTLAAYLMFRGYRLLNDDAVPLLSDTQKLLPIPVSLSIKEGSWPVLAAVFPELDNLRDFGPADRRLKYLPPHDNQICTQPVKCELLILPDYSPDHVNTVVKELSVVYVFEQIILSGCIIEHPIQADMLASLISWLDKMPCYRLSYSSLASAEQKISQLLDSHAMPHEEVK